MAISSSFFNVSHWLFASTYHKVSVEMPFVMENQLVDLEVKDKHKAQHCRLLTLNIVLGVVMLIFLPIFEVFIFKSDNSANK